MDSDPAGTRPLSGPDLVAIRHDRLRRTAPAVQHEVNNALMVLASNLELLGRSAVEGAPRRQLDRATEAMRRLDQTTRSFLDAARREAEDPAAVMVGEALGQALPLLRVALGARFGIDLAVAEGGWPVRLDRARLDLALLSLMREAAGRMEPGARIAAAVEHRAGSGEAALLLTLPPSAAPEGETARLLHDAATATGGRTEAVPGGMALLWPRTQGV